MKINVELKTEITCRDNSNAILRGLSDMHPNPPHNASVESAFFIYMCIYIYIFIYFLTPSLYSPPSYFSASFWPARQMTEPRPQEHQPIIG